MYFFFRPLISWNILQRLKSSYFCYILISCLLLDVNFSVFLVVWLFGWFIISKILLIIHSFCICSSSWSSFFHQSSIICLIDSCCSLVVLILFFLLFRFIYVLLWISSFHFDIIALITYFTESLIKCCEVNLISRDIISYFPCVDSNRG